MHSFSLGHQLILIRRLGQEGFQVQLTVLRLHSCHKDMNVGMHLHVC